MAMGPLTVNYSKFSFVKFWKLSSHKKILLLVVGVVDYSPSLLIPIFYTGFLPWLYKWMKRKTNTLMVVWAPDSSEEMAHRETIFRLIFMRSYKWNGIFWIFRFFHFLTFLQIQSHRIEQLAWISIQTVWCSNCMQISWRLKMNGWMDQQFLVTATERLARWHRPPPPRSWWDAQFINSPMDF